ncbi:VOC family protein [Pseudoalteromonas luteoviolacea]|uniref:VOC family protein n=1 Tax=Pseudoalteromonas luteoviolacea TaxID=43657 RepID=UPI00115065E2|nr:VOC family protein [Pseudoalteromonas luteoviolacea]TQF66719.1 lactoylglutathione lyase [Pseudoalteromonas luteoviolacea]
MAKMLHSMIRVKDLARSLQFYHDLFDLKVKRQIEFEQFSLTYLGNSHSEFELELTHNYTQNESYDLGNGYGHLAFCVDELDKIWRKAKQLGLAPKDIKEFYNQKQFIAKFFFITDPDGYQIEVIERNSIFS